MEQAEREGWQGWEEGGRGEEQPSNVLAPGRRGDCHAWHGHGAGGDFRAGHGHSHADGVYLFFNFHDAAINKGVSGLIKFDSN